MRNSGNNTNLDDFLDTGDLVKDAVKDFIEENEDITKAGRQAAGQQLENAHRIMLVAEALRTVPSCHPGDPSCTPPPPTEEPANCDPRVTGSCFPESGNSPCTPAEVSGATCKSGEIECTQTPLKHDILCQVDFPEGGFWQGVYFTPPGLDPQFIETLYTPNPNPPPFNNCVTTSH